MLEVDDCRRLLEAELQGLVLVGDLDERDAHAVAVVVELLHLLARKTCDRNETMTKHRNRSVILKKTSLNVAYLSI